MKERSTESPLSRSVENRKRRKHEWITKIGFVIVLFMIAGGSGCAPSNDATCAGGTGNELIDDFEFVGAGFHNPAADGLVPSDVFWFSGSDDEARRTVTYGWDSSLLQLRRSDVATCNYSAPGDGCRKCDYCTNNAGACSNGTTAGLSGGSGPVVSLFGSTNPNESETLITDFFQPYDGCFARSRPPSFEVDDDSTFSIRKTFFCGSQDWLATFQAKVIVNPTKKLERTSLYWNDMDPALRYVFSMPVNAQGKLRENFSANLRVKKVRVLLGVVDTVTGQLMDGPISDTKTLARVQPSRIMFLTDFINGDINESDSETENRCYLDPEQADKSFDLFSCLRDIGGSKVRKDLTPTYMIVEPSRTLTWVIEYRIEAGLTEIPVFDPKEVPILEFTIE